ncbi:S-adenosyl-L-methionine-dependent methyltransferase [Trinorchestia longiramus]|nr:S-adenosyl-L-methionine-dependent methyltransferase [Trinorchestia longiramus]
MEFLTETVCEKSAPIPEVSVQHFIPTAAAPSDSQPLQKWAQWCGEAWRALLTQAHLVSLPISRVLWSKVAEALPTHISPEEQEALGDLCLLSTVLHPLTLQYPRDLTTELLTLLWLHDVFRERGWNSCRLQLCIAAYQNLIQEQSYDEQELVYKSYVLDASKLQEYEKREWLKAVEKMNRFRENPSEIVIKNGLNITHSPSSFKITTSSQKDICSKKNFSQNIEKNLSNAKNRVNSPKGYQNTYEFLADIKHDIFMAFAESISRTSGSMFSSEDENLKNSFKLQDDMNIPDYRIVDNETFAQYIECGDGSQGVEEPCHVTLLEAGRGITRGTTGLTSWGGGAVMAEWIDNNAQVVRGKRVLELGAGIGYMAASIIKRSQSKSNSCRSRKELTKANQNITSKQTTCGMEFGGSTEDEGVMSYTATDCHPHVLDLLHHNLTLTDVSEPPSYSRLSAHRRQQCQLLAKDELPPGAAAAQPWSSPHSCVSVGGVEVKVLQQDWRSVDLDTLPHCDVILAADVVYARHLLPYLSRLLRLLLSRQACNGASHPGSLNSTERSAYIACTRRDPETISEFLAALKAENLNHSIVYQATLDAESALFVYNESHIPVKIYKITLDGRKI